MEKIIPNEAMKDMDLEALINAYAVLLNSLPHPAMLISNNKVVLSTNKIASDMGIQVGGHCWRGFMKAEFLSNKNQIAVKNYPNIVPAELDVQCSFCRGDLCLTASSTQNEPGLAVFDKKWNIYWIPCNHDVFLHYAVDITDKSRFEDSLKAEGQKMKNILDGIYVGTWELNVQTGEQTINERWADIIGFTIEELSPISVETWTGNMHPEDLKKVQRHLDDLFGKKINNYDIEFRMRHKNGDYVWINSRGKVNSWTTDGKPLVTSGIHIDITPRKLMEQNLIESEDRYRNLFNLEGNALFLIDRITGNILEANVSACHNYGYAHEELLSLKNTDMSAEPKKTKQATKTFNEAKTSIPLRFHKKKDGTVFPVEITASAFMLKGRETHLIATRDISERIKAGDEINYLNYHDQLTGLYNRRFYEEELKRLDTERNLPLTIAMGDVNGLKLTNDSFGHALGDKLLRKVADIIKEGCRADDIIARVGGDEFVIILPKTDTAEAEKVIARIKALTNKKKAAALDISVSFGYETKTHKKQKIEDILKGAEDHMYRHKLYEGASIRSEMIGLIMNTLFEKNNREQLHSKKVSEICEKIAANMNFDEDDLNQIRIAGLMHDIGKIGIDERVINRIGTLNDEEWREIQKHPEIGYRILSSANEFSEIAVFILDHHERWDGEGYPKGIKGEEISLPARIIAVADAYDAMTRERTYKPVLSKEAAIDEIKNCSGSQFDPGIVRVFIEKVALTLQSQIFIEKVVETL